MTDGRQWQVAGNAAEVCEDYRRRTAWVRALHDRVVPKRAGPVRRRARG